MTRRSKREIAQGVESLEDENPGTLDGQDMWEWIQAVADGGGDVGRPPAYFGADLEWAENLCTFRDRAAERFPELAHLTPPEAYALCYMDEETASAVIEALRESDSEAAERWEGAVDGRREAEA